MKYIEQIQSYLPSNEQEENDKKVILQYIESFPHNILTRKNEIAHITSSGIIVDETCTYILFIYHKIYNTWGWTGGHADGEEDMLKVARKEAFEETGLKDLTLVGDNIAAIDILPVWGHIKKGKYVSAHLHLNVSYIFTADMKSELILNEEETAGVKWIPIAEMEKYSNEPVLIEVYKKIIAYGKKNMRS